MQNFNAFFAIYRGVIREELWQKGVNLKALSEMAWSDEEDDLSGRLRVASTYIFEALQAIDQGVTENELRLSNFFDDHPETDPENDLKGQE